MQLGKIAENGVSVVNDIEFLKEIGGIIYQGWLLAFISTSLKQGPIIWK